MKKTQITLALNALALAGMLVFAAPTANAAGQTLDPSVDVEASQNSAAATDNSTDVVADASSIDDANEVASVDVEDVDTPDVGEVDSVAEIESEGPESN